MKYEQKNLLNAKSILYLRNKDAFYTSEGKYIPDIYLSNVLDIKEKQDFMKLINNGIIPEIFTFQGIKNKLDMNVVFTFPISTNNAFDRDATVIFILDRKSISKRLFDIVGLLPGVFSIYKDRKLLYTSSDDINSLKLKNSYSITMDKFEEGYSKGKKYGIYKKLTSKTGLLCYYEMNFENRLVKASDFWKDVSFSIIIVLLTGVLVAALLSYYNYKPIKTLIKIIQQSHPDDTRNLSNKNEVCKN